MRRPRIRTFRLFERLLDGPSRYVAPTACDGCGTKDDDDHATWCRSSGAESAVQAAAHHLGSVHEIAPGEDVSPEDEPYADRLSRVLSALTSRAPSAGRSPRRDGRAGRRA